MNSQQSQLSQQSTSTISTQQQMEQATQTLVSLTQSLAQQNQNQDQQSTRAALIKKLTSRKFILSLIGVIAGILGMIGCNDNIIAFCVFAAIEVISIVVYMVIEGKLDAKSISYSTTIIEQIVQMIQQLTKGEDIVIPENKVSDKIVGQLTSGVPVAPANNVIEIEDNTTNTVE